MLIYGINPVLEALKAGRVREVRVDGAARERVRDIRALAEANRVPVRVVSAQDLDRSARGGVHQGVAADLADAPDYSVQELVSSAQGPPLIVVLDGIEDPHNLGAILRTVDASGGDGVIRQTRHAARLDGAAAKASAGAVSHVRIANVVNIARAIGELKDAGVWTIGLAADAPEPYDAIDFTQPSALVLGAEGEGLRRLVRESCDRLASIPMRGHVSSVNVSVAAAIVLFEAVRQRRARHSR
ncbi:MAG TPA: 23S rRNA (guanosine(2251)-2'-O)-methyltransferase RlmB [Vicinamibacterales bacterium]|nr:23S rRNA (guanosine(2251)-2'-O)-methyltransferase RlmB [Vicinamibacterales bacterium]